MKRGGVGSRWPHGKVVGGFAGRTMEELVDKTIERAKHDTDHLSPTELEEFARKLLKELGAAES